MYNNAFLCKLCSLFQLNVLNGNGSTLGVYAQIAPFTILTRAEHNLSEP